MHATEMQKAYINKTIREVAALFPIEFHALQMKVIAKLMPHVEPTDADRKLIREEIISLIIDGKMDINKGKVSVEGRYRVNSVEEDYKLNNIENPEGIKNINGTYEILSVGSERYPFYWQPLEINKTIEVELIAEPQNKKDPLAVAICIDKKPYAYLPRPEAFKYHPLIQKANNHGFLIVTQAKVGTYEHNPSVKLFILKVAPSEILENHLTRTLGE